MLWLYALGIIGILNILISFPQPLRVLLLVPIIVFTAHLQGSVRHSSSYRKPDAYKNRTVLLVGISVSAREILNEVKKVAKKVILSSSRYQQGLGALLENREYDSQQSEKQPHASDNIQLIPPITG